MSITPSSLTTLSLLTLIARHVVTPSIVMASSYAQDDVVSVDSPTFVVRQVGAAQHKGPVVDKTQPDELLPGISTQACPANLQGSVTAPVRDVNVTTIFQYGAFDVNGDYGNAQTKVTFVWNINKDDWKGGWDDIRVGGFLMEIIDEQSNPRGCFRLINDTTGASGELNENNIRAHKKVQRLMRTTSLTSTDVSDDVTYNPFSDNLPTFRCENCYSITHGTVLLKFRILYLIYNSDVLLVKRTKLTDQWASVFISERGSGGSESSFAPVWDLSPALWVTDAVVQSQPCESSVLASVQLAPSHLRFNSYRLNLIYCDVLPSKTSPWCKGNVSKEKITVADDQLYATVEFKNIKREGTYQLQYGPDPIPEERSCAAVSGCKCQFNKTYVQNFESRVCERTNCSISGCRHPLFNFKFKPVDAPGSADCQVQIVTPLLSLAQIVGIVAGCITAVFLIFLLLIQRTLKHDLSISEFEKRKIFIIYGADNPQQKAAVHAFYHWLEARARCVISIDMTIVDYRAIAADSTTYTMKNIETLDKVILFNSQLVSDWSTLRTTANECNDRHSEIHQNGQDVLEPFLHPMLSYIRRIAFHDKSDWMINHFILVRFKDTPRHTETARNLIYHGREYELMDDIEPLLFKIHGIQSRRRFWTRRNRIKELSSNEYMASSVEGLRLYEAIKQLEEGSASLPTSEEVGVGAGERWWAPADLQDGGREEGDEEAHRFIPPQHDANNYDSDQSILQTPLNRVSVQTSEYNQPELLDNQTLQSVFEPRTDSGFQDGFQQRTPANARTENTQPDHDFIQLNPSDRRSDDLLSVASDTDLYWTPGIDTNDVTGRGFRDDDAIDAVSFRSPSTVSSTSITSSEYAHKFSVFNNES